MKRIAHLLALAALVAPPIAGASVSPAAAQGAALSGAPVAPVAHPAGPAEGGPAEAQERPLGREDLLEISVFEVPELNRTVRIAQNGTVSLPLLGDVRAEGLTPRELEVRLRERLSERWVRNPQVSVFIKEHGSKRVSVLGGVGKPGVYEMLGPRTLLQVLALAGGLTEDAGRELYVIRVGADGGEAARTAIDLLDLMSNRDPALNVAIEPGDVVSVPLDRSLYIYVDGAVKTPGRIEQPASRSLTLLQAIAKAGGATERANLRKVHVLRKRPDGTQENLAVDVRRVRKGSAPDPILQDGDVVVVAESFF